MRSPLQRPALSGAHLPVPHTVIEPATEADLGEIEVLAERIWRACYSRILSPGQIDYMLKWMYSPGTLKDDLRNGVRFDLMSIEGQRSGFASYGPTQPDRSIKLHKLYLIPEWHGRGLGSLLLQHCEREARRLGATRIILNVNKANTSALAAYKRNGFATVNSVVTDIGGGYVMDDFVMAKALTPG